jgi:ligand-binding SRPBCC domain-containing protein
MPEEILERTQRVPTPVEETFDFFADPRNLEAITPPWLHFRILEAPARLDRGSLLRYRLRIFGMPIGWRTEITEWKRPHGFVDEQLRGPYRLWIHEHRLEPDEGGTVVHDRIRYRIPLGAIGRLAGRLFVRRWLGEIFDYREARIEERLTREAPAPTLR